MHRLALTSLVACLTAVAAGGQDLLKGNGGFERGDLTGWRIVSGGGWEVMDFDHPNKSGRYYATTCDAIWPGDGGCKSSSGESDTGVLSSDVFQVAGRYLEFRIAGFSGTDCGRGLNHVSLRRASDNRVLREAAVPCQNPFQRVTWRLDELRGQEVYARVQDDDGATGWAWIAVDDFRWRETSADTLTPVEDLQLEPEVGQITFTSRRSGGEHIYTMAADGTGMTPLTRVGWKMYHPAWSADGLLLAAVSNRGGGGMDIYAMGLLGIRQLTVDPASDHHPAWSPDGQRIAFVSDRHGPGDLYLMPSTGGQPVRRTSGLSISDPTWSPTGQHIAFSSGGDILAVDESGIVETVVGTPAWEGHPAWSPDGAQIAYVADGELLVLDIPSGGIRQLTQAYSPVTDPSWSPDQRHIAFASNRVGNQEIYVGELASGRLGRVTHDPADDFEPVWYPGDRPLPEIPTAVQGRQAHGTARLLLENYPNPFNATTIICYELSQATAVELAVVDILGRRVATLASGRHEAGSYRLEWAARDDAGVALGSGVYILRLVAGEDVSLRRVLMLR